MAARGGNANAAGGGAGGNNAAGGGGGQGGGMNEHVEFTVKVRRAPPELCCRIRTLSRFFLFKIKMAVGRAVWFFSW